MLACDPTVGFNAAAWTIGILEFRWKQEDKLEGFRKAYWQYQELFDNEKAEMLAPRPTLDHAIDLKDGATPPGDPYTQYRHTH